MVVAKAPVAGAVKTRLCPPLSYEQAARLAAASLADTLAAGLASSASRCVLALDGPPGPWAPGGVQLMAQRAGGLGERLAGAMADAWQLDPAPMLVVGMDTPQITPALLDAVAGSLLEAESDVVLGEADDGGYWVIGSRRPVRGMFAGVPMSTDQTCERQRRRVLDLGLRCRPVATLRDVDCIADALAVAAEAPRTRFARQLRALGAASAAGTLAPAGHFRT